MMENFTVLFKPARFAVSAAVLLKLSVYLPQRRMGTEGVAPIILKLSTISGSVVSFSPGCFNL